MDEGHGRSLLAARFGTVLITATGRGWGVESVKPGSAPVIAHGTSAIRLQSMKLESDHEILNILRLTEQNPIESSRKSDAFS